MTQFADDLTQCICAGYPLLYVVTWEEERALESLRGVARHLERTLVIWTVTEGLREDGRRVAVPLARRGPDTSDPMVALEEIQSFDGEQVVALLDYHPYLNDPRLIRKLRDLIQRLKTRRTSLVMVSPVLRLPTELAKSVEVLDLALPDREGLGQTLDHALRGLRQDSTMEISLGRQTRERLIRAAQGLTRDEFDNAVSKAAHRCGGINDSVVGVVVAEKKQIVRKSGILEFYDPDGTLDEVGGLYDLKSWLRKRGDAFTDRARDFGIPPPRGLLLVGIQGCGKSMAAKAIAVQWSQPLLRLDVGRVFSGTVGSSEENMRQAIRTAESVAPVILWVDEVEKGFSGTSSSNYSDAGTAARVFGSFMTWMQEKRHSVFVVATANDVRQLPPEMLRKGRFDEIFFVDLPTLQEREAVFRIHLRRRGRNPDQFDLGALAAQSEGFSGAEIEESILSGLYDAFEQQRPLENDDIVTNLEATVPLVKTMDREVASLREWARGRARRASESR